MNKARLIELNNLIKSAGELIQAFHCGRDIGDGKFSIDYLGSGEGMAILGPGIYFITSQSIAEVYSKHHDVPFLYSVMIDKANFYEGNTGKPEHCRDSLFKIIDDLELKLGRKVKNKNHESLTYGRGGIGDINKAVGGKECNRLLVENGIDGAIEKLPGGDIELCVFNADCIKSIEKIPFSRPPEPKISQREWEW
jgi:hypothetical protein